MTAFNRSVAAQASAPLRRLGLITLMAATILVAFAVQFPKESPHGWCGLDQSS